MSEMTFEQMLEDSFKNIHTGDIVEGTVISVTPSEIAVNIGYKSDGIVTKNEYSNDPSVELTEAVKPGDSISVKVLKLNDGDGQVVLSHKRIASEKVSKVLEDAFNDHTVLKAKVSEVVKGGLVATVDEVPVFIPASLASDTFTKNLNVFADKEIEFYMSEFNPAKRRYIGDCKTLLRERRDAAKEQALSHIAEGDVVEGTIKNVTSFGAFVDIGGIDGLLHISEMSWGRIDYPQNVFKKGDTVKVIIKEIKGDKVALSAKFDENNPWLGVENKYPVGTIVNGKVARMTDFGAFVQLEEGVDALLHVSQISRKRIEKPSDVLSVGDEIEAKVVDINIDDHKISLSMKELIAEEEDSAEIAGTSDAEEVNE
ncbi:MAG: 30S ribosomal protein S1 [Lachnospiraceae bacterium]|nr:30S ribosomal protein S1 [Lachnospiraceae bacterium]